MRDLISPELYLLLCPFHCVMRSVGNLVKIVRKWTTGEVDVDNPIGVYNRPGGSTFTVRREPEHMNNPYTCRPILLCDNLVTAVLLTSWGN
jgi:hypothetical protein